MHPSFKVFSPLAILALCAGAFVAAQTPKHHYQDPANGIGFDYSADWRPLKPETDTDYLRPSIQPVRAAIVLDITRAPYEGTDFAGLAFSYILGKQKTAPACAAAILQNGEAPGMAVTISGRTFATSEGGDAAMNHQLEERLFSAFANGRCYIFDLQLSTEGFGAEKDIRQMQQAERDNAQKKLDEIMGTVKITTSTM